MNEKLQIANWTASRHTFPDLNSQISNLRFLCLFFFVTYATAFAADPPPKPAQPSTDDALRNSLDSHAGDDYDRALLGEPGKVETKDRGKDDLAKKLKQQLDAAAQREDSQKNPLLQVAEGMDEVHKRLAAGKSDAVTQQAQRQIVSNLEKFIDEAKKSAKTAGRSDVAGSRMPSGKPDDAPSPRSAPSQRAAVEPPARQSNPNRRDKSKEAVAENKVREHRALMEAYIMELRQKQHEEMLELPSEYFLPEYERETEDYFRRLSAGKAAQERP